MKLSSIAITIALFTMICSIAHATELPQPPKNYAWVRCEETKSAFLKPKGWHFKKQHKGDVWDYYITRENIEKSGYFKTGVTISVIPNIPAKKGMIASRYAEAFIATAAKSREAIEDPWTQSMGPFNGYGVVLLNRDEKEGDFFTHNLSIANDETGTVYIVIFESPTDTWDDDWKIAEPIIKRLLIDTDI
jgi:hypothetical protein